MSAPPADTVRDEKEQAFLELQTTQTQMLHQERVATLGQLLAGIAHDPDLSAAAARRS